MIGHDEADARVQLDPMPFDLGHDAARGLLQLCAW